MLLCVGGEKAQAEVSAIVMHSTLRKFCALWCANANGHVVGMTIPSRKKKLPYLLPLNFAWTRVSARLLLQVSEKNPPFRRRGVGGGAERQVVWKVVVAFDFA